MKNILNEFNSSNSTNDKLSIMKKYKDNKLVIEVFQKAYDKVKWTWGVSMKNIPTYDSANNKPLQWALKELELLADRTYTGNNAKTHLINIFNNISKDNGYVIKRIIERDLKINFGKTGYNEVVDKKNKCIRPCYMRCDLLRTDTIENGKIKKGTIRNIDFTNGAYIELKADGRFTETSKTLNSIIFETRNGKEHFYNTFKELFNKIEDTGYFHGEMTVKLDDELFEKILPKLIKADKKNKTNNVEKITREYNEHKIKNLEYILPRSIGNGLLNSKEVPEDNIIYDLWDYITEEDYMLASLKDKKNKPKIPYEERFKKLQELVSIISSPKIRVIEYKEVFSIKEAMEFVQEKMNEGLEGGVLKNKSMLFKDGTSNEQLKCKLIISGEFRVVGFIEGKKGTKREQTFGSIMFENDEGTIKGSTSGFSDLQLQEINNNRDKWIGKVIEIEFNDVTKAVNNTYYALSHPRFVADRSNEKNETDTLERCLQMKQMAMELKQI